MQAGAWSQTLQSAVSNLIDNHSITVVVATGNSQVDACEITPANVNGTLAVAGSDMSSKFDTTQTNSDILYEYDNTGSCVDIFAPGVDIMAACGGAGNDFPWKTTFSSLCLCRYQNALLILCLCPLSCIVNVMSMWYSSCDICGFPMWTVLPFT